MRTTYFALVCAVILAGCASTSSPYIEKNISEIAPHKKDCATLVILHSGKGSDVLSSTLGLFGISNGSTFIPTSNPFETYDYYLDCLKYECKIATMKYGQYVVIHPTVGLHELYVIPSQPQPITPDSPNLIKSVVSAVDDRINYISHESIFSLSSTSVLRYMNQEDGKNSLMNMLEKHHKLGDKYGTEGIVYEK